jgi:hypothetical protein
VMLSCKDFGRSEQRRLRTDLTAASIASSATSVFPEPTSPCSSRSIGADCAMSPRISSITRRCLR